MPATLEARHTIADYEALPEGAPYQLIDGELVMSPAPTPNHQDISSELFAALRAFVIENGLGKVYYAPLDVYLSEDDIFQPDILFISRDRLGIITDKNIQGAPDLVVEILSLSTSYYDLTAKKRAYEAAGVKEYWIVDPMAARIEVYENRDGRFEVVSEAEGKGEVDSKVLNSFRLEIEPLFE
ncbi:MAG TPA: Uma2 family endonuclease [Rhodothermales bacterium]|nr:Uma2 family endonuclease [Rhodothermales bacterium]